MVLHSYSDYGSGSSMDSNFLDLESWLPLATRAVERPRQKSASYADLVQGRCTLGDVMREFRMNGSDTSYVPDDEFWTPSTGNLVTIIDLAITERVEAGSSIGYLRQSSWPAPELTPAHPLPRRRPGPTPVFTPILPVTWNNEFSSFAQEVTATSTPINDDNSPSWCSQQDVLTKEQRSVLTSLSDHTIYTLLKQIEVVRGDRKNKRFDECRFCKNNGEREAYYKTHTLKNNAGRVICPVLRAFVCRRCGASGDTAHTAKYCPLATVAERQKSAAVLHSMRHATGRRRNDVAWSVSPARLHLEPQWAALEQKLLL